MSFLTTTRRRFLMCSPDHYGVEYVINPWMEGNLARADASAAAQQWAGLRAILENHAEVEILPGIPRLPDLVFTANAGLVLGNQFVLSQFRHPERRGEEPVFRAWFERAGFDVTAMPPGVYFEGAGDALLDRGTDRLYMGYGFRTDLAASDFLAEQLGIAVTPLHLVDERFYHLDTCFCPLHDGWLMYFPGAFDERSLSMIERLIPADRRIEVADRDALHFGCNAVELGGSIVMNDASPKLEDRLKNAGLRVLRTPLTEFIMAGGAAKCLTLRLDEPFIDRRLSAGSVRLPTASRTIHFTGHLIDSGVLGRVTDLIPSAGGTYEIKSFIPGARREDTSEMLLQVTAPEAEKLDGIVGELLALGGEVKDGVLREATLTPVDIAGTAPEGFYGTTIFPTDAYIGGEWITAQKQRMDAALVVDREAKTVTCRLLRDLKLGDLVVTGTGGIRMRTQRDLQDDPSEFKFMGSAVSSERRVEIAVEQVAWEMSRIRNRRGRIVFVGGPVVIHTGGGPHLAALVRGGYVQALLAGNAIAVHDIENAFYGTSLGVDLRRGVPVGGGHLHHITAINTIRRCGGIAEAVEKGVLRSGLFFELTKAKVPYCLAGSIRDDGPLPETLMDLVEAQREYARLLEGADMIVMLSTMLHSIGVGNMTPAGIRLICVDINPSVATKLADRGSVDSTPIVTDVGLFLNLLDRRLTEIG